MQSISGSASDTNAAPFTVWLRGEQQPAAHGLRFTAPTPTEALAAALAVTDYPAPNPLVEWWDDERLCCLDVDYHHTPAAERLTPARLDFVLVRVRPGPIFAHRSHGGGAKLYFVNDGAYTARELAALAGATWKKLDGRATLELKRSSRSPHYPRVKPDATDPPAGPVRREHPTRDMTAAHSLLSGARELDDGSAAQEWCAANGRRIGERAEHRGNYPFDPDADAHNDAVCYLDHGIYCQRCAAKGVTYNGGSVPGFVPYAVLLGRRSGPAGQLVECVRRCARFHVVRKPRAELVGVPDHGPILLPLYSGLCKAYHAATTGLTPDVRTRIARLHMPENRITNYELMSSAGDVETPPPTESGSATGRKTGRVLSSGSEVGT